MDPVPSAGDAADAGSAGAPPDAHRPTEIHALLGRGTRFEGKLDFEGRVRIDGGFKGEIRGEDVLVIGEGAFVEGEVHVATCIVTGGEVRANIRARDGIELYAPAKVVGALHAPAIFIDRGVKFEGTCKMAPLDEDGADGLAPPGASGATTASAADEAPPTPRVVEPLAPRPFLGSDRER
jgi:cytoskeletal protein CcmA (bactofilin family)